MTGSEPDSGGAGKGKSLAWRSRSSRDMGKDMGSVTGRDSGRDAAGSVSGRDIGRDIANWWTAAVEQTSTFILDEVPATFAGLSVGAKELKPTLTLASLSVGAKELKPTLTRGSSFSSFTLPWKTTVDGSKGVEDPKLQEGAATSVQEAPKCEPSKASPKSLEKSHSRKQTVNGHEPSISSPKPLERSHSRKQAEKAVEQSTSSPKRLERSPLKITKEVETNYEPIVLSPKHSETPKLVEKLPQVSGFETPKHLGKSPLCGMETPKPSESSPVITPDPRSSTGRQGESRRRTKRMAVDAATSEFDSSPAQAVCLSTVSQEFLLGDGTAPGSAKVHSLEVLQRQQFWTPQKARTDSPDKSKSNPNSSTKTGSAKRSSASRSLARSLHLEGNGKNLSPQLTAVGTPESCDRPAVQPKSVGVVLPREEIFPGKTNSLPQIKVRTPRVIESSTNLSKNPIIGGSTRVTQRDESREDTRTRLAGSLPTSPRYTSGESRTARLLRRLKFTGRGSGAGSDDSKLGKKRSSNQAGKAMTDLGPKESSDLHRNFSGTLEPKKLDFSFMNWTDPDLGKHMLRESRAAEIAADNRTEHDPAERSEVHSGNGAVSSSVPKVRKQQGNLSSETPIKKSSAWPWTFKWKWGPKSKSKTAKSASKSNSIPLPRPAKTGQRTDQCDTSPTADIMSDARDTFVSQSDRFSSSGSADKLASDRAPKHRRVLSWGADSTSSLCSGSNPTMAAFTPGQPRLATRDAQELLVPPRKLIVPPTVNMTRRSQEQVALPEVRRSNPGVNVLRGSADTDVFEDCFGSFRSTDSPTKSYGSFRSIESPTVSSSSIRKTALSIDADEWDSHLSSSFRQEINRCNDDPCTSVPKFILRCPKVQHFNKFLRTQKERLRSGLDTGNTDRFCIVLTGRDLELSSIVAAMSYAWLQENSFPKVSGDAWHPIPMIDIPRQHMDKHRDAAWLFDACGIDPGSVLFADEVELSVLVGAGRIKMSIIGQDVLVTRNEVGSVCTLLMEMLLAEHRGLLQPRYLKAFMLAGILLDTENLDFASIRDTAMSNILVEGMGCFGRTSFYNQLREAEGDARVSKLITQNYDNQPSARLKLRVEAEHEHSDRDSIFTQSQDHTSTSEAGTNSSLDEDSPRPKLKQRNSFRYSRLTPHSAPARSHRLSLPGGCLDQDAQAVANIRKAATQTGHPSSAQPSYGQNPHRAKPGAFARIRKKLFFEG
ncbi:hypothetical protein M758_8G137000 [Ceratodon purpureus]|nr:hypothetical protein M758_8G137000 [Ceratodon purpureus]